MPGKVVYAEDSPNAPQNEGGKSRKSKKSGSEVPEGTASEILGWVGNDKERAKKALEAEQRDEKPRSGLTSDLQRIINEGEDQEEKGDSE